MSASIRRSNLEKRKALLPVVALTGLLLSGIAQNVLAFGFDDVAKKAEDLSQQGYSEPERNLPDELRTWIMLNTSRSSSSATATSGAVTECLLR